MDTRLLVIAAPVLVAASWALFNIGRLAIQQNSTNSTFITLKNNYKARKTKNSLVIVL
jgi:hypothetical protein